MNAVALLPGPPPAPRFLVYPSFDFETYSEAGHVWNDGTQKWVCLPKASQGKKGLQVVGAAVYAEHPTTEVLTLSYDLLDGLGTRRWRPGMPAPQDLFGHIARGGLLSGWNVSFEHHIWNEVCVRKYGWPPLPQRQLRCTMARARHFNYPGKLADAGTVGDWEIQKDPAGDALLKKFSVPRNPTKKDARLRHRPEEFPEDAERLYGYCDTDVATEQCGATHLPPLEGEELEFWLCDQAINYRGVKIDTEGVHNCIAVIDQAHEQYDTEMAVLTMGAVGKCSELDKLKSWLAAWSVYTDSLDEEHIEDLLKRLPKHGDPFVFNNTQGRYPPRRALELRGFVGSAAVKKVYAMRNQATANGYLCDLFTYHGARTGRATGNGPQPTNLPNSGPAVHKCKHCEAWFAAEKVICPGCAKMRGPGKPKEWNPDAAEFALELMKARSLHLLQYYFGDAMHVVGACLRPLFRASDDHDLIGSDYSSIEAVGLAELAGEEWRRDVFRTHGKIYETSASRISGIPFEDFMTHAGYSAAQLAEDKWWEQPPANPGSHHPLRKTIGKIAELACFGADTLVLTRRGYTPITEVRIDDKLWDGEEWVGHNGVIFKGKREVMELEGVIVTPDHPIFVGEGKWETARVLGDSIFRYYQAAMTAELLLPEGRSASAIQFPFSSQVTKRHKVFDIVHAGPRNRFTIKTKSGHLIVHNSGYQGWVGSWKAFGADEFLSDEEIREGVLGWRKASPAIVEFWGGQQRYGQPEYYGVEGAFIQAVLSPGHTFECRGNQFVMRGDALYLKLISGRGLVYHRPRLGPNGDRFGFSISYEGWNTNPKNGPYGWIRMRTWGGRLVENITQATCRDLLRFAIINLEATGKYRVVLHVYDEIVVEVREGEGSIEEVEEIMMRRPAWAKDWPIRASGGWRGKRYRKG